MLAMQEMSEVIDNAGWSRFELEEEGKLAFADYHKSDGILTISHVEADPALRGRGTAGRLMEGVLQSAREQALKIRPLCGYAAAYIQRYEKHHDLLA